MHYLHRILILSVLVAPLVAAQEPLRIAYASWDAIHGIEPHREELERCAGGPIAFQRVDAGHPAAAADVVLLNLDDEGKPPPLLDLSALLAAAGICQDRFPASSLSTWRSGAQLLALPLTATPVLLAWRRDLARELGVDPAAAATWDAFAELGRDLRRRHPEARLIRLSLRPWTLSVLLRQRDVPIVDAEGHPAFDSAEGAAVMLWVACQLSGQHAIARGGRDSEELAAGRVLCALVDGEGMQELRDLTDQIGHAFLLTPLPRWVADGRRTSATGRDRAVGISAASRRPAAAWAVVQALATTADWHAEMSWAYRSLPAWRAVWEDPLFSHAEARFGGASWGRALIGVAGEMPGLRRGEAGSAVEDALIAAGAAAKKLVTGSGDQAELAAALLPELHRLCGRSP